MHLIFQSEEMILVDCRVHQVRPKWRYIRSETHQTAIVALVVEVRGDS